MVVGDVTIHAVFFGNTLCFDEKCMYGIWWYKLVVKNDLFRT